MISHDDNFTVGDIVEWTHWAPGNSGQTLRGSVIRVTPATVTARPDNAAYADKTFRRRKYETAFECRKVDTAREQWQRDLETWWESRPSLAVLDLAPHLLRHGANVRLTGSVHATFDNLTSLVDEANAIREWLLRRPEEPK